MMDAIPMGNEAEMRGKREGSGERIIIVNK